MRKNIIAAVLLILLASASAYAENFTVGAGPMGNIFVVDSSPQLSPGVGGYVYFDYRWSPQLSTQFNFIVSTEDGSGPNSGDNGIMFFGLPAIDFKYYVLSSESHWDPYIMAGVGLYVLSEGSVDNGTLAVGYGANAGLGCDYYLSEKWSIGAAASFRGVALIDSTSGNNNGTAVFPFSLTGNVGFHF